MSQPEIHEIRGGVTAPLGFSANGARCGLKRNGKDLAIIYSDVPAMARGLWTSNKVQAAHIYLDKKHIKSGIAQAIVVNSGNANCCNGRAGIKDASLMAQAAASHLDIYPYTVLVASTGVIGKRLPIKNILDTIPVLIKGMRRNGSRDAARAIMTTDTVPKEAAVRFNINGRTVTIGGIAKGSGMVSPNMATMLSFITTDAAISHNCLKSALDKAVDKSFNRITIDGDMSTNDTVIMLANGLSGNKLINENDNSFNLFCTGLEYVAVSLAKMLVKDGEGATKFIEINVRGARNKIEANKVACRVSNSNLVKTMVHGGDPNWGRLAASAGAASVNMRENLLDIYIGDVRVMRKGVGAEFDVIKLRRLINKKEVKITVDLNMGNGSGTMWTCDLSEEYVRLNAEYET
ncbi:MAG: bifunctional glutamate N-acetyltransferase/amino-acid acetyltransferase ArgJ [Candidatus Omnitrophica bacterium]|nr:bifunctional glutamate N-acetyltransferase/amino-acid acetyltransferase ArgJ [Candidatus Omnitrophota bacterium]